MPKRMIGKEREREKGRRVDIERDKRERGEKEIERVKVKERGKERVKGRRQKGREDFTPKERVQSSGNLPTGEIKRKERLITKNMMRNYEQKLSGEIMSRNYNTKL